MLILGTAPGQARSQIIFQEDFESETLHPRWVKNREDTTLAGFERRKEHVHSGEQSFHITVFPGTKESASGMLTWLEPGHDQLHLRFYVKFAEGFDPGRGMHWVGISAHDRDDPSFTLGSAGIRPNGRNRFITSLDPVRRWWNDSGELAPPPGRLAFYSYWPDMKASPGGKYWGNYFYPDQPFNPELGRWYCIEVMLKGNDPGKANGEQALWVDGEKIIHLRDFRWRDVEKLKVNLITYGLYMRESIQKCTYWIDDMVVSREYIGPMSKVE